MIVLHSLIDHALQRRPNALVAQPTLLHTLPRGPIKRKLMHSARRNDRRLQESNIASGLRETDGLQGGEARQQQRVGLDGVGHDEHQDGRQPRHGHAAAHPHHRVGVAERRHIARVGDGDRAAAAAREVGQHRPLVQQVRQRDVLRVDAVLQVPRDPPAPGPRQRKSGYVGAGGRNSRLDVALCHHRPEADVVLVAVHRAGRPHAPGPEERGVGLQHGVLGARLRPRVVREVGAVRPQVVVVLRVPVDLHVALRRRAPRRDPEVDRPDRDRCRGRREEDVGAGVAGCAEHVFRAVNVDDCAPVQEDLVAFSGPDRRRRVYDRHRQRCNALRPRLRKGRLDRLHIRDVSLHKLHLFSLASV